MPKTAKTKQQVDGLPFLPKSGYGRLLRIKRSRWVVFVARHPSQMNCFGPLCGCGIFGLVKYRHVWERMGSGGPRGLQNRCEACKTSWMCSIHIRSRQRISPKPPQRCLSPLWWFRNVRETASKHAICVPGAQKRFYLHRNQNETSARRLMRNFAATVRYYPYSIKFAAHRVPRPTFFVSHHWRKHELHAESSRRAQGPLSRAA